MRYEIQLPYSLDTLLDFGSTNPKQTVEQYLNYLLGCNHGTHEILFPTARNPTIIVVFAEKEDAQEVFNELYGKLTPRMFSQSPEGQATFLSTTLKHGSFSITEGSS